MQNKNIRNFCATFLAASLLATGVGTAFAQGPSNDSAVSNITESFGSLTIHKYKQTGPDGAAGNGLQAEITNGDPLDGVKFVIAKVKDDSVDLSTNAGWDAVGTFMTQHPNGEGTDGLLDEALEKTTADGGLAAFENLPIGLYLVKEQLTEEQKNQGIVGIDNFYVTVPMVNPNDSSSWNYDVHVYPKNTQHTVTKTVNDELVYKAGDSFNWTVSATLPASPVGINSYIIADKFDDNLEYKSTKVYIGKTALTEGEDYNLQIEGQVVKVVLTTDTEGKGVKRFADNAGKQLRAVFETVVKTDATFGNIANKGKLFINDPAVDFDKGGIETNTTPEVRYGGISLTKKGSDGRTLEGVEFDLYAVKGYGDIFANCSADSTLKPIAALPDGAEKVATKLTTGVGGVLKIDGLRNSTYYDGKDHADGGHGFNCYYLVETKTKSGYNLLAQPVSFRVTDTADASAVEIVNTKSLAGTLPLTGGNGAMLLIGAGALILAGSGVYTVRKYKTSKL